MVDQVFLFRELASTVAPFASKHTSALNSELLIVNKNHLLDASYSLTQVKFGIPNTCNVCALYQSRSHMVREIIDTNCINVEDSDLRGLLAGLLLDAAVRGVWPTVR